MVPASDGASITINEVFNLMLNAAQNVSLIYHALRQFEIMRHCKHVGNSSRKLFSIPVDVAILLLRTKRAPAT